MYIISNVNDLFRKHVEYFQKQDVFLEKYVKFNYLIFLHVYVRKFLH